MTEDKVRKQIEEFLQEEKPSSSVEYAENFGYLKGLLGKDITQEKYSEIAGINSRTLRKYIKENQKEYDASLALGQDHAEPSFDLTAADKRTLSEEQIDKFVETLYQAAISGTARDRELLINFTGMNPQEVLRLQHSKATTLRWFIKENLSKLVGIDPKDLGIHLYESELLDGGDKAGLNNAQTFINKSISDEGFKMELMLYGMLFLQMYNNKKHPDYPLVSAAARISRLEQGTAQPLNRRLVKQYAAGKDIKKNNKAVSTQQLKESLQAVYDPEQVDEMLLQMQEAKAVTAPPALDRLEVQERATEYAEELEVLLTNEEEMRKLFSK